MPDMIGVPITPFAFAVADSSERESKHEGFHYKGLGVKGHVGHDRWTIKGVWADSNYVGGSRRRLWTGLTQRWPSLHFANCWWLKNQDSAESASFESVIYQCAVKNSSKTEDQTSKIDLKCQICRRKSHSALNCYNRLNLKKFPPSHTHELSLLGPTRSNRATPQSANLMTMWYPDSGATSYITAASWNVQRPRPYSSNECILMEDGSLLPISSCGRSVVCSLANKSFILQDLLLVPAASCNLLSVNKLYGDKNVYLVFDSQKVQVCDPATKEVFMES